MITIVKFIKNKREDAADNNTIITKTLGKTGALDWERVKQHGRQPKAEEFWFVEIVKEKGAGTAGGLFVLDPIEKISTIEGNKPDIIRMIPGTYTTELKENTLLIHPHKLWYPEKLGPNWICGLSTKRNLMNKHKVDGKFTVNSIIVVFDRSSDWPREAHQKRKKTAPRQRVFSVKTQQERQNETSARNT